MIGIIAGLSTALTLLLAIAVVAMRRLHQSVRRLEAATDALTRLGDATPDQ